MFSFTLLSGLLKSVDKRFTLACLTPRLNMQFGLAYYNGFTKLTWLAMISGFTAKKRLARIFGFTVCIGWHSPAALHY
jgi:hypothetical protein